MLFSCTNKGVHLIVFASILNIERRFILLFLDVRFAFRSTFQTFIPHWDTSMDLTCLSLVYRVSTYCGFLACSYFLGPGFTLPMPKQKTVGIHTRPNSHPTLDRATGKQSRLATLFESLRRYYASVEDAVCGS